MSLHWKNIKKLGLGVMAFEGSEHLENILSELRDLIDLTIIAYLDISYHNDPIDLSDLATLFALKEKGLADEYINVKLNVTLEARILETDKRNLIILFAEDKGCSHIIIIDADEFYTHDSFYNALKEIDENDYPITYCLYVNYYHDYNHYLVYPFKDGMHVPFVSRVKYRHSFDTNDFNLPSDPTRRYVIPKDINGNLEVKNYVFPWETVKMHHLSWLRVNIRKKLKAWSSKKCFENQELLIDKAVYDFEHFDDIIKNEKKVHLIFNTPGNQVLVEKFPKQYIFPKYDFYKTYIHAELQKRILILNLSSTACNGLFEKLEKSCRETWVLNKTDNMIYYSVIDGDKDFIDEENKVIYIKNVTDNNLNNLLYRFCKAVSLLSLAGIDFDYIIRTNTSTWLNLPLINKILANETDESIMYGFSYLAAFWSLYHLYLSGLLLIMSKRTFNIINDECNKNVNLYFKNENSIADDILIGSIFYTRCMNMNIPEDTYIKVLPCTYNDNNKDICASQIKIFNTDDINARKEIEPENMLKFHQQYMDNNYNIDELYECFKESKGGNLIFVNVIPYKKHDWINNINEPTKRAARGEYIKPYYYTEFKEYTDKLRKAAGYTR